VFVRAKDVGGHNASIGKPWQTNVTVDALPCHMVTQLV